MEETVRGVFPVDVGGMSQWLIHYYEMCFTEKRILAYPVGKGGFPRAFSKKRIFLGGWLDFGIIDYLLIRPLTGRKNKKPLDGSLLEIENAVKGDGNGFIWTYQTDIESIRFREHVGWGGPPGMEVRLAGNGKKIGVFRREYLNELKSILREVAGDKILVV